MGKRPAMMRTPPRNPSADEVPSGTTHLGWVFVGDSRRVDRGETRRRRFATRSTRWAESTFARTADEVLVAPPTFERPNVSSTRMEGCFGMVPGASPYAAVEARGRRRLPGEEQRVNNSDCMKRTSEARTVGVHV